MRKLYTLSLAIVLGLGIASAAVPESMQDLKRIDYVDFNTAQKLTPIRATVTPPAKPTDAVVNSIPADAKDLAGFYITSAFIISNPTQTQPEETILSSVMFEFVEGNKVKIGPLYFKDAIFSGDYNPETGTITISKDQSVNIGTVDIHMYTLNLTNQETSDVVLKYDEETGVIYFESSYDYIGAETITVFSEKDADPLDFKVAFYGLYFVKSNAYMLSQEYYNDGLSQPFIDYIKCNIVDGKLEILNFYGFGISHPIYLTLDEDNQTATATDQVVSSDSQYGDLYLWSVSNAGNPQNRTVVFDCMHQNEKTILSKNYLIWTDKNKQVGDYIYNCVIHIPFDIFNPSAGVGEIEVSETEAVTEYFNLQGIRVENPQNGLYIRRTGSTSTKVYIK